MFGGTSKLGKTILVYGGDLPAVSAAAKAAATAMTETIHLIVPYVPQDVYKRQTNYRKINVRTHRLSILSSVENIVKCFFSQGNNLLQYQFCITLSLYFFW